MDQHRDPNNRVLPNLCGLGMVEERRECGEWGDCWSLSFFFFLFLFLGGWGGGGLVLLEPTEEITEGERAVRELLAWHRLRGNGNIPNRRNKYYFAVDSNLSLSSTVVYGYKR